MYIVAYATPNGTVEAFCSAYAGGAAEHINLIESAHSMYGLGVQTGTVSEMASLILELGGEPFALQGAGEQFAWIAGPASHGMWDLGVTAPWLAYIDHGHPQWALRDEPPVTLDPTDAYRSHGSIG